MTSFLTGAFKIRNGRREGNDALYDADLHSRYVANDQATVLIKALGGAADPLLPEDSPVLASGQSERADAYGAAYGSVLHVADNRTCLETRSEATLGTMPPKFVFTGYMHNVIWGLGLHDPPVLKLELENHEEPCTHYAGYVFPPLL